jgi:NAD(P)-dependent dehydrogenase (short-subunit alcohol dehydrogenase family)
MLELSGRGAIVAGTRRVGAAVATRLAREGVGLAILYRSSREPAERLLEQVQGVGVPGSLIQADLTVEAEVAAAVRQAKADLGDVSFCVNLAADYPRAPLEALDTAAWEAGMGGALGTYLLAVHAARAMAANSGPTRGHLVFCGDWAAGETPYADHLPYLTGKAAIHFMTRAFARELAAQGILVNAVAPGPTEQAAGLSDAAWGRAVDYTPLHRESSAADIAEVVCALLRLETMTGETIRVDSGRHIAGTPLREV